jgi:glycosyltransferase involved in cell wall biosynthesis
MWSFGGLERNTFEVLRVLAERGAALHCRFNHERGDRLLDEARALGVTVSIAPPFERFDRRRASPRKVLAWTAACAKQSAHLLGDARRFAPTHVLLPDFHLAIRHAPALGVVRALGVRVVLHLNNAPVPGAFHGRFWRWVVSPVVDDIVCVSEFTERALRAHRVGTHKARVIYNTVTTRGGRAAASAPPSSIIYVGQLVRGKGVDLLLEALARVRAAGVDANLNIVGRCEGWVQAEDVGYRESLMERAERPDLAGHVRFLGEREDVPALMAQAAVHCCPSRREVREAFGLVVLEAKAAGVPSVVCETGALPELVTHGHDGWIAHESPESLAAGLLALLGDPERRREAGTAARASLERFNRQRFARAWCEVFDGLPA